MPIRTSWRTSKGLRHQDHEEHKASPRSSCSSWSWCLIFVYGFEARHVAHLAAGARLRFSIQVQTGAGFGQQLGPSIDFITDQVLHHGIGGALDRAERQAAD